MSFDGYHCHCYHPQYAPISNNPPAIIYINTDLTPSIIQTFTTQLYLSQVYINASDFDGYVASNPDYYAQVHMNNQRILVLRDLHDYTNRDLADFVLFAKNGLVSILNCRRGVPRKTLPIARIYITAIKQHGYNFWDFYRGRCCLHLEHWDDRYCCTHEFHHFWWDEDVFGGPIGREFRREFGRNFGCSCPPHHFGEDFECCCPPHFPR